MTESIVDSLEVIDGKDRHPNARPPRANRALSSVNPRLARVTRPEPASEASLFYWGSVAKSLAAILVLQLVEEGKLKLDDRLARLR